MAASKVSIDLLRCLRPYSPTITLFMGWPPGAVCGRAWGSTAASSKGFGLIEPPPITSAIMRSTARAGEVGHVERRRRSCPKTCVSAPEESRLRLCVRMVADGRKSAPDPQGDGCPFAAQHVLSSRNADIAFRDLEQRL